MLNACILLLLAVTHCKEIIGIPQRHFPRSLAATEPGAQVVIKDIEKVIPVVPFRVVAPIRKKKGPTLPMSISVQHQLLVPNLHVIPISSVHRVHGGAGDVPALVSHTVTHANTTIARQQLLPVLIPIHNHLVPIHDLTVIPLHGVVHEDTKVGFKISDGRGGDESVNNYRNPLGGYGAGWYYGGHGAGHGFHYAYG